MSIENNQEIQNHLMSNMWKPLITHVIFQLGWLAIQIKFEFPAWIFFSVMLSAFILLILWPSYEKKKFGKTMT